MDGESIYILFLIILGFAGGLGGQIWVSDLFQRKQLPENIEKDLRKTKSETLLKRKLFFALKGQRSTLKEIFAISPIFLPFLLGTFLSGIAGSTAAGFGGMFLGGIGWATGWVMRKVANNNFSKKNKLDWKDWYRRQTRRAALQVLTDLPPQKAVTALNQIINQLDNESFLFLVPNLKRLPKEVVSEVMLTATKNNRDWIRRRAVEILAWHYPKTVEENMNTFIRHRDPEMRKLAYTALLRLPRSQTIKWLQMGKRDPSKTVSYKVREIEQTVSSRTAWPDLTEEGGYNTYGDYLPEVREFWQGFLSASWEEADALRALTEEANMGDWILYLDILQSAPEEPFVRTVIRMLEQHPPAPRITASLIKLMLHHNPEIQLAAEEGLESKGHKPLQAIRAHWGTLPKTVKEKIIGRVPDLKQQDHKDLYNTFLTALKDKDSSIRWQALESIRRIDETWLLNLLLLYCKRMPPESAPAFQDAEWVAARKAIESWLERMPVKAETAETAVCSQCLTRGAGLERAIWQVPGCRKCEKNEFLVPNIREIVGRIGPVVDTNLPMGDVFPVELWDQDKRTAIYSDVDRVEVIGGAEIDYDWAVSAVLERLKNSDQPERAKVPFNLVNDPPISVNTKRMIWGREEAV